MNLTTGHAVIGLLALVGLAVLAGRIATHRKRKAHVDIAGDYLESVGMDHAPHATELPSWVPALVALAAVFGAVASGVAITQPQAERARNDSSQAQTNRSTCLSTLNANWRLAYDDIGIVLTTERGHLVDQATAAKLHLPRDPRLVLRIGHARLVAAAADDLRIGDEDHPICPFVAGDPDRTSEQPVNSATADLERRLHLLGY